MTSQKPQRIWRCGIAAAACCLAMAPFSSADPPTAPLPVPEYSFDVESPTVDDAIVDAVDILELAFPHPIAAVTGPSFGFAAPGDDLDALSSGHEGTGDLDPFMLLFSVGRATVGAVLPDPGLVAQGIPYNVRHQSIRGHAAGDQFLTTESFTCEGDIVPMFGGRRDNHFLTRNNFDEGGTDFAAWPETSAETWVVPGAEQDRVDAMAALERTLSGAVSSFYFSMTSDSPSVQNSAGGPGPGGATIWFAAPATDQPLGTCCLLDGGCEPTTVWQCDGIGIWLGPNVPCVECDGVLPPGACCFADEQCVELPPFMCDELGGDWIGAGVSCEHCTTGPDGACCFEGACEQMPLTECEALGGIWHGPGSTCDSCSAFDLAACCLGDTCDEMEFEDCLALGGIWLGDGASCSACELPGAPGACCLINGGCEFMTELDCNDLSGIFLGPQSICAMCEDAMGVVGVCCLGPAGCDELPMLACLLLEGVFLGPDAQCADCPSGPAVLGACCLPDGECIELPEFECVQIGGDWQGAQTTCAQCSDGGAAREIIVYASPAQLGLEQEDDLDALVVLDRGIIGVFDANDIVLFSLAPGSPSLESIDGASETGAAADVFIVGPGSAPRTFVRARVLGLGEHADDIDALDMQLAGASPGSPLQHGIRAPEPKRKR